MTTREERSEQPPAAPTPDPMQAVSYLLSGVIVYGLAGWLLDRWIGTSFLVGVGIVVGAGLGTVMVWFRWGRVTDAGSGAPQASPQAAVPEGTTKKQERQ